MGTPTDSIRRQHRYTITPEHLILDPRVSDRAFRLWCRLDRFAGEKASAYPARETLAIELDCSPSSIDRSTRELVGAGWLLKERKEAGGTCEYVLVTAPEKDVERLVKLARDARLEATQPRREAARGRRREAKKVASVKGAAGEANPEVTAGGVVTGDKTPGIRGVVTGDKTPVVTGDERGVVTGDEQKEAPLEGSTREGDSVSSLRSETAEGDGLTESERETGRDPDGNPLKGAKLNALSRQITVAWIDWCKAEGHVVTQSFGPVVSAVKAGLAGGANPGHLKHAMANIAREGRPVTQATIRIAYQAVAVPAEMNGATPRRKGEPDWDKAAALAAEYDRVTGQTA